MPNKALHRTAIPLCSIDAGELGRESLRVTLKTNMLRLKKSAEAWKSPEFEGILIKEVSSLGLKYLPLQKGLSSSSVALDHDLKMMLLSK